eukprot:TRINITY_DN28099_c0_g1_i1.p2 TRINITY_DN28099_c0_g1~~TRINITY_DN28099_c0_g1_i1.p2  ORF type:complete len:199 (-),score=34.46 TRINITY_DN28099_c0_g1_i1:379-975(-)
MSVKHTVRDVALEQVQTFVEKYLAGQLTPAAHGRSADKLSFHLPKFHSSHKCRSGRFHRVHTGGSLLYNCKTRTLIINKAAKGKRNVKDIKKLWDMFCADESPEVPLREKVRESQKSYHKLKKTKGKYRGQFFRTAYKQSDYVDWILTEGPQYIRDENAWLFFEYCRGLRERKENDVTAPGSSDGRGTKRKAREVIED